LIKVILAGKVTCVSHKPCKYNIQIPGLYKTRCACNKNSRLACGIKLQNEIILGSKCKQKLHYFIFQYNYYIVSKTKQKCNKIKTIITLYY
jgi:hypothetical protein